MTYSGHKLLLLRSLDVVFVIFTELLVSSALTTPARSARNGQPLSVGQDRTRQ